jgi:glyoxylase-like metal-dependent hydrolase (beta-lactamase superfamily II)
MRVHHLNCGTMCPLAARLVDGESDLFAAARLVCHCLLIETRDGLVLVDTGLGTADLRDARARLGRGFVVVTRPRLDPEEPAARQVERLGFRPGDVRHVVVTHLDLDHAGGLADFPEAEVHLLEAELDAALHPENRFAVQRYRRAHFAHGPRWRPHAVDEGERWYGFERARPIASVGDELLLVPLVGHTRGHTGVAVREEAGWLLHCGDAYFFRGEMLEPPRCPVGLRLLQRLDDADHGARVANQRRLRELARDHGREARLFCAHDPVELARAAAPVARRAATE